MKYHCPLDGSNEWRQRYCQIKVLIYYVAKVDLNDIENDTASTKILRLPTTFFEKEGKRITLPSSLKVYRGSLTFLYIYQTYSRYS